MFLILTNYGKITLMHWYDGREVLAVKLVHSPSTNSLASDSNKTDFVFSGVHVEYFYTR